MRPAKKHQSKEKYGANAIRYMLARRMRFITSVKASVEALYVVISSFKNQEDDRIVTIDVFQTRLRNFEKLLVNTVESLKSSTSEQVNNTVRAVELWEKKDNQEQSVVSTLQMISSRNIDELTIITEVCQNIIDLAVWSEMAVPSYWAEESAFVGHAEDVENQLDGLSDHVNGILRSNANKSYDMQILTLESQLWRGTKVPESTLSTK